MLFHPSSFASLFSSSSFLPLDRLGAWRTSLVGIYSQACQQALHSLLTPTYAHLLPRRHSQSPPTSPPSLDHLASTFSCETSPSSVTDCEHVGKRVSDIQIASPTVKRRRTSINLEEAKAVLQPVDADSDSDEDAFLPSPPPSPARSDSTCPPSPLFDDLELVAEPLVEEPIRSQAFDFKLGYVDELLLTSAVGFFLPTADAHDLARAHLVRLIELEEARELDYDARRGDVRLASTIVLNTGREHAVACYLEGDKARDERFKQRIERELEVYLAFLDVSPRSHPSLFRRGPPPPPQQTTSKWLVSAFTPLTESDLPEPHFPPPPSPSAAPTLHLTDLRTLRHVLSLPPPPSHDNPDRRREEWNGASFALQDAFLSRSCVKRMHAFDKAEIWAPAWTAMREGRWDGWMGSEVRERAVVEEEVMLEVEEVCEIRLVGTPSPTLEVAYFAPDDAPTFDWSAEEDDDDYFAAPPEFA
ncbi:hypothetical protein JCM10207_006984 [Rhodosporidiobolus poonsookiae]